MADVSERARQKISGLFGIDKEKLEDSTRFLEDLQADSLDITELALELEHEFSVSVPDEEAKNLKTVGDAIRYLEEKLNQ